MIGIIVARKLPVVVEALGTSETRGQAGWFILLPGTFMKAIINRPG
jgi:hypothetical protein